MFIHSISDIKKLQNAAMILRKEKIPFGINLLLTSETVEKLEYIIKKIKKMKVHKVLFLKYKITNKNRNIEGLKLSYEQEYSL